MKLSTQITIQQFETSKNSVGEEEKTWSDFATVRAARHTLRERERFVSQQIATETECEFLIRYLSGIDETMRVVHDGQNYDITGIIPVNDRIRAHLVYARRSK